ncbi:MAG: hypothetical protein ILP19_01880 [Oscillospiraceae bacterium]|nr:hypothetical protein [Oscillospiraceae bacterium]
MKVRKAVAAVAAAVMTLSIASASAFAIDYSIPTYHGAGDPWLTRTSADTPAPSLVAPIFPEVTDDDGVTKKIITAADIKKAVADGSSISIPADGAILNKSAASEIAKSGTTVSFTGADGTSFSIDSASVSAAKNTEIGFIIEYGDDYINIYPIGTGSYGFDVNVTINFNRIPEGLDVDSARFYHITDTDVEEMDGLSKTEDGLSVTISTRSYYKITSAGIEDVSAGAGVNGDGAAV